MKKIFLSLLLTSFAFSGEDYQKELKSGLNGWSVSVFGGANLNRPSKTSLSESGTDLNISTKNQGIGFVAGLKGAYDFKPFNKGDAVEVSPSTL